MLGFFAVPTAAIAADAPAVFAQLDRETIYEGESVIYDVRVANLRNPPQPDMSAFDDDFCGSFSRVAKIEVPGRLPLSTVE